MKLNLGEVFKPRLFELFKKGAYDKEMFVSDLIAGIIVGIIALPLAIAFGIASGVTPQQGLITAIIAGFLISFFGGSNFLVGGPTGAFIVIVYGIVAQFGVNGLIIATIMAGIILILMGIFKLGNLIKFIPYPIVVGFTSGIAVVIFTSQLKDFFGFSVESLPGGCIEQWLCYFQNITTINVAETLMAIVSLFIIIYFPKITKKIPGSLIAILITTIVGLILTNYVDGVTFATIGSKFPELGSSAGFPKPTIPTIDFATARQLFQPAITIALLCAIESLLAAMVADGVTGKRHNSNTELIGQGIANVITPLFGGIPATGAIARTMASINNGAKSPVTGIVHAIVLLLIFLFLMPLAKYIPLSCLAAILVVVAYNMSEWKTFKYLLKGDKADVAVLLITFFLTVIIDLTVAIEVGIVLAVILFVKRVSETSHIKLLKEDSVAGTENDELAQLTDTDRLDIPAGVEVYEIDGPFFFGLASKIDELERYRSQTTKIRIIRMRKVPFIDSTGLNNLRNLWQRSTREEIQIILSGVTREVHSTLERSGFVDELGSEYVFPHIIPALAKANEILDKQ